MPNKVTIDDSNVRDLIDRLTDFGETSISKPIEKSTRNLLSLLRDNVESGRDTSGNQYEPIKDVTEDMVIARSGPFSDSRKRSEVTSNRTAMNVTGQSSDSLNYTKISDTEFNVGYDGARSDVVFKSNAQDHGNSNKPKRDPLGLTVGIATDAEFNILADEIEKALEVLLSGG